MTKLFGSLAGMLLFSAVLGAAAVTDIDDGTRPEPDCYVSGKPGRNGNWQPDEKGQDCLDEWYLYGDETGFYGVLDSAE